MGGVRVLGVILILVGCLLLYIVATAEETHEERVITTDSFAVHQGDVIVNETVYEDAEVVSYHDGNLTIEEGFRRNVVLDLAFGSFCALVIVVGILFVIIDKD